MPRPLYFDCDTGIDDSVALAYLLASPEIEIVGIGTVSGNVSAASAADNTLRLLALADRNDVPVAIGAHDPLGGTFDGGAPHVHGANGIGGIAIPAATSRPVDEDAADLLIRLSRQYEGELEVLTVGPLTNIGLALQRDPELPGRVARVTAMGGAALVPGNITAVAEANIGNDPEAAAALAVGGMEAAVAPAVPVAVDTTEGPGRGQTVCDLRGQRQGTVDRKGANVRVVLSTTKPFAPHLLERLSGVPQAG